MSVYKDSFRIYDLLTHIDWNAVISGTSVFVFAIILKTLLDLNLAIKVVKYFSWLPVRNIFRAKPPSLKGTWETTWHHGGSVDFKSDNSRHSQGQLWQLGHYCYAEFYAKGVKFYLFGEIKNGYFVGSWHEPADRFGYFGGFHLELIDSNTMKGKWIGHSKKEKKVRSDEFFSKKIDL